MELQSIAAAIISIAISLFAFNIKSKEYNAICFRGFLFLMSLIFLGFAILLFIVSFWK